MTGSEFSRASSLSVYDQLTARFEAEPKNCVYFTELMNLFDITTPRAATDIDFSNALAEARQSISEWHNAERISPHDSECYWNSQKTT